MATPLLDYIYKEPIPKSGHIPGYQGSECFTPLSFSPFPLPSSAQEPGSDRGGQRLPGGAGQGLTFPRQVHTNPDPCSLGPGGFRHPGSLLFPHHSHYCWIRTPVAYHSSTLLWLVPRAASGFPSGPSISSLWSAPGVGASACAGTAGLTQILSRPTLEDSLVWRG